MFSVLVLCTGNSARSQIAEALLAKRGAGSIEAASAGASPASAVNPLAVATLARHGIAWEGRVPKSIDAVAGREWDLLITVCDNANEACPYFPGVRSRVHWGLPDPHDAADFERTWAVLSHLVDALIALPLASMDHAEVQERAQKLHA